MQAGISDFLKEYIGWKIFRGFLRVIWGLFHVFGGYFRGRTSSKVKNIQPGPQMVIFLMVRRYRRPHVLFVDVEAPYIDIYELSPSEKQDLGFLLQTPNLLMQMHMTTAESSVRISCCNFVEVRPNVSLTHSRNISLHVRLAPLFQAILHLFV
jgi:hypothetical protein